MSIYFATDPEPVPSDLPERELAWLRAIAREDYVWAAKLARAPLPGGTTTKEKRKWYMRKFQMRGVTVEASSAPVENSAAGAPDVVITPAGALQT